MTDKTRIKVAVIFTALFLAGISTLGLASRKHGPATAPPAAATVQQLAPVAQTPRYAAQDDDEGYESASYEEREHDE